MDNIKGLTKSELVYKMLSMKGNRRYIIIEEMKKSELIAIYNNLKKL